MIKVGVVWLGLSVRTRSTVEETFVNTVKPRHMSPSRCMCKNTCFKTDAAACRHALAAPGWRDLKPLPCVPKRVGDIDERL